MADVWVKILFSVVYASFGLLHLVRLREIVANEGPSRTRFAADPAIGLVVGVLGGLLASVHRGRGRHPAVRHAGAALPHGYPGRDPDGGHPDGVHLAGRRGLPSLAAIWPAAPAGRRSLEVFPYWLAAAPIVAVGGPLGSLVSRFVPRRSLLGFVAVLCLVQYCLDLLPRAHRGWSLVLAALAVLAVNLALHSLFVFGWRSLPLKV